MPRENPIDTLMFLNNFGLLCQDQEKYNKAEGLYNQAVQLLLGIEHVNALNICNSGSIVRPRLTHPVFRNLASLYQAQGRYDEARSLLGCILFPNKQILGSEHPGTLETQRQYIFVKVSMGHMDEALRLLEDQEKRLLSHSFQELYNSSSENVRRKYLQLVTIFQDMALSLANLQPKENYQHFAAEVMLRWKQIYAEERISQHEMLHRDWNLNAVALRKKLTEQELH